MRTLRSSDQARANDFILCVGLTPCLQRTLVFSRLIPGEVNRAQSVTETASGKATNVARVIRALGGRSLLIGFVGGDTGKRFVKHLKEDGLEYAFAETNAVTRICQTLIDESSGQVTELVEEAALPVADERETLRAIYREALENASLVVISGSPPPGYDADVYRDLIEAAHERNCRVLLDSQKLPLEKAIPARPWMIKINHAEFETTVDRKLASENELRAAADELIKQGVQHLVVTRGAESVRLFSRDLSSRFEPPKIKAINPIGSGDSMAAGIAYAIVRGEPLESAIQEGIACGAANALTATPGVVDPEMVSRMARL